MQCGQCLVSKRPPPARPLHLGRQQNNGIPKRLCAIKEHHLGVFDSLHASSAPTSPLTGGGQRRSMTDSTRYREDEIRDQRTSRTGGSGGSDGESVGPQSGMGYSPRSKQRLLFCPPLSLWSLRYQNKHDLFRFLTPLHVFKFLSNSMMDEHDCSYIYLYIYIYM